MIRSDRSRWRPLLALLAVVALFAAACGDDDDDGSSSSSDSDSDSSSSSDGDAAADDSSSADAADDASDADTDDDMVDDDEDTASEPAVEEDRTLTIYAPWNETRTDWVTAAAAADLDIDVEFLAVGGGEIVDRMVAERNNTQADIALGVGEAQINLIAAEGIFAPYEPAWSDKVPAAYVDDENLFTLFAQVPIVMAYNPEFMDEADAPTSWTDLADPAYEGQFLLPGLGGQTGQSTIAGILWRFADPATGEVSDEGWQVLTDIYANQYEIGAGEEFNPGWFTDGTLPIFISWRGGVAGMVADNEGLELRVIDTEGGTPFVSTGVAITAATDSPGVAQEFVDWFGSADTQIRFVGEAGNDPPANVDAIPELETASEWLSGVSLQEIDWGVVSVVIGDWLERIELDLIG